MNEKEAKYQLLLEQVKALISGETDQIAIMANVAAAIHETMQFFWTGFYRVSPLPHPANDGTDKELLLGPFQGPVACIHIGYGRGVCGTAWQQRQTIIVADVEQFPGHIACSSLSRSEIVVPVFDADGLITAVLDIDSRELNTFDDTDRYWLEQICRLLNR
ncbi:MAG: GAF domain-containing protein [Prevotella sp.]|nr:GAF domain-containing protein [Prevotella sp.]MBQ9203769.1 GAF domain-containing protein [Prevotella sp.]MBQ9645236.1 GAF domain-containing protein [Prevotella sp.]